MTAQKKREILTGGIAALLIVCAVAACVVTRGHLEAPYFLPVSLLRSLIYIGLMTWWGISLWQRIVQTQVRRYLEDNYMFDLSLDSVGEILHISPAYLSAQFKKYQKMNFLDCLTELRINAAKELLADPFRSSAEVASMVGYEDASYFARAFKKRTGMTPTQYRRQAGKKSAEAHL